MPTAAATAAAISTYGSFRRFLPRLPCLECGERCSTTGGSLAAEGSGRYNESHQLPSSEVPLILATVPTAPMLTKSSGKLPVTSRPRRYRPCLPNQPSSGHICGERVARRWSCIDPGNDAGWVQRQLRCSGRTPDHAGPAVGVVQDALLGDFVGCRVGEAGGEEKDNLVLGAASPLEDVLQDAEEPYACQALPDLFLELPAQGVQRVLTKLHMTAERALERGSFRPRVFRHQQRTVAGPPNHCHRLDNLRLRAHEAVVSRQTAVVNGSAGVDADAPRSDSTEVRQRRARVRWP